MDDVDDACVRVPGRTRGPKRRIEVQESDERLRPFDAAHVEPAARASSNSPPDGSRRVGTEGPNSTGGLADLGTGRVAGRTLQSSNRGREGWMSGPGGATQSAVLVPVPA